jgi:hypothetical protein
MQYEAFLTPCFQNSYNLVEFVGYLFEQLYLLALHMLLPFLQLSCLAGNLRKIP